MANYDSNIIKPVEGLHNIAHVTPTGQRKQRKRRQNLNEENSPESEQKLNNSVDEQNLNDEQDLEDELAQAEDDQNTIDYRA